MSDLMLHGVLNMTPDLWTDSPVDKAQRQSRYVEASKRIKELEADMEWQPIETAPDKKVLILFEPHSMGGFQFFGAKSLDGKWFSILGYKKQLHPTHWRPHNCPHPNDHGPNQ